MRPMVNHNGVISNDAEHDAEHDVEHDAERAATGDERPATA
jgi:hypothetical protein